MILSKRKKRLFVMFLLTVLKVALVLAQSTIRVPADAPTIQAGIDGAENGDTVLVFPGVYNENIDFKGKAITVTSGAKSFAEAATTIINVVGDGAGVTFDNGETAAATLNGFTVQNAHTDPANCSQGEGVYINGASPTISNNAIVNNTIYGIYITGQSSPIIEGNDVKGTHYDTTDVPSCHSLGNGGAGIILVNAASPEIIGNTIEDNICDTTGSTLSQGAGVVVASTQRLLLKSNIIRNNIANGDGAIAGFTFNSFTMVQNLIYGNSTNQGGGIFLSGTYQMPTRPTLTEINNTIYGIQEMIYSFDPSTIENNIFSGAGLECADPVSLASPFTIRNNDNFTEGTPSQYPCNLGSGNISVDPNLRDPANGDFHEHESSPTVAAGDLDAPDIPGSDLDNKARTVCNTIDMGAYEFRPHPPIALSSSQNPAPGGSSLTFTARLTGNCNVPTGAVTFFDGSTAIGSSALNGSAVATLTTSFLVVGRHNITAQYSGDFNFESSTSDILVQTITGDPTATSLAVSPNPASAFSPVNMSSVVTSQYGTPTGSVVFSAGGTTLATASLNATGRATATISNLGAGSYSITANYTADTRFQPSNSAPMQETVVGADTATTLTASPNPAAVTQTVTFTTQVRAAQGTVMPNGSVTLTDGTVDIGTVSLNANGIATFSVSTLSFGTHAITAKYAGSANFNASSATLSEAVTLIGTSLALTTSPNPANTGQTVTLTATTTSMVADMVPVGTITFYDGSTVLTTAGLGDNGVATFSTSSLAVGTHPIKAVLASGSYFAGNSSAVVNEVVQAYDFTLTTSRTVLTIPSGDYSNMTVTVTPVGGFTSSVSLSCDGMPDHTQCVFPQGSTVSLADGAKTVTLSINTSDIYGYGKLVSRSTPPRNGGNRGGPMAALLLPLFGILGLTERKRGILRSLRTACLAIGFAAGVLCLQSCSGKLPGKTPPGTYTLTVAGASTAGPSLQHSAPVQLTVTP